MTNTRTPFALSPIERNDPLWIKLRVYMERCIADHRQDNDNPHGEAKTAEIRGRIAAYKGLIALDRNPIDFGVPTIFPAAHSDGK